MADFDIIGALKKSKVDATIYFCRYSSECFKWEQIVKLLESCCLMQDLNEDEIFCVAVESNDGLNEDKHLVGITFKNGKDYISLVPKNYSDLNFYLDELTSDACSA